MPLFRDDTTPAERQYTDWVDRKEATLRRRTLDCGHRNAGEVFYHGWCDRLSCSTVCAEAEHDCEQFKGKSGGEKEAVEPEAAVEAPAVPPRQPFTLDPETYRALYGPPELDVSAVPPPNWQWTDIVDPVEPGHMVTLDNSSATFTPDRFVRLLVEGEEVYQGAGLG